MMWLDLIAAIDCAIDNDDIDQFGEVTLDTLIQMLEKASKEK